MGTLESEDGGGCCFLLKLPFSLTALYPYLSSIIIFHNSLTDFCVTTKVGGRTALEQDIF